MPFAHSLESAWRSPHPPLSLRVLAALYALGWRAYQASYRLGLKKRWHAAVPVVGVGSLWVGGVGKTPITVAIARGLSEQGKRVVILTHGYGGTRYHTTTLIAPHEFPPAHQVGDETLEIRTLLPDIPLAVGKRRVEAARQAVACWKPDVLVLDDGFQHLPLARTIDLVVLPYAEPFGNGYCLPAGPLREPRSGLSRASAVLSVGGLPSQPLHPLPCFEVVIRPSMLLNLHTNQVHPLEELRTRPITAMCAIARPERFLQTLADLGATIESAHLFPDHYPFQPLDLRVQSGERLVMTLKDAVKVRSMLPPSVEAYALCITAILPGEFWGWIFPNLLSGKQESSRN